jgi:antitoxin (DNA-binding transcriptional repressor) of toxin-antitoxin stability system
MSKVTVKEKAVTLADAKARLSELTELAAAGESVIITKRGKPVARLSRPERPRKPVDVEALRQLTASMPAQAEEAAEFIRRMREDARY